MPNIKSAKKRVLVNNKKTELNKNIRSAVKTAMKKVDLLIKEGNLDQAKIALNDAFSAIDSAASKNIYHANNASNKKAKLAKRLNSALATSTPVVEVKEEVKVEAPVEAVEEVKVEAPAKKTTTKKTTAKKAEASSEEKPAKKTTTRKTATKKAADKE